MTGKPRIDSAAVGLLARASLMCVLATMVCGSAIGAAASTGASPAVPSMGCGKARTLENGTITVQSGGVPRTYILRTPDNYDNGHPYRLILGFHGATGNAGQVAPSFFGLFDLSKGTTIFAAPSAVRGLWNAATDKILVDEMLKAITNDLCIDTTRIELEGFSQGAAMAWTLACDMPGVFRAAVGHSGGGVPNPTTCEPIAYLGSLGLRENGGQSTQTDQFARWNSCTIEALPTAPVGGHLCTEYKDCSTGHPVRFCPYDGGHTPSPRDAGEDTSWMPDEVWSFLSRF
jgi:poly(3-hydroxybutyrate) depolymerase